MKRELTPIMQGFLIEMVKRASILSDVPMLPSKLADLIARITTLFPTSVASSALQSAQKTTPTFKDMEEYKARIVARERGELPPV